MTSTLLCVFIAWCVSSGDNFNVHFLCINSAVWRGGCGMSMIQGHAETAVNYTSIFAVGLCIG